MSEKHDDLTDEQTPQDNASDSDESATNMQEVEMLKAALQAALDEREDLRNQLMRSVADFQNFRKRNETEKVATRAYANERLVVDLLPVLDNFERTFAALQAGSSIDSIMGGIQAVERQLRQVLESHNVSRVPAQGKEFDPEIHEAIGTVASEEHPENTVLEEVEPGYKMVDRIIRPARVRVSTKP